MEADIRHHAPNGSFVCIANTCAVFHLAVATQVRFEPIATDAAVAINVGDAQKADFAKLSWRPSAKFEKSILMPHRDQSVS
ncbi:hypothetical protein [Ruegeria arenilitoris]|uniref:hypothetical protein n=1 Tax=Ruegeria arenilitoris TaxID=1173585 RepID=UPI00147B68D7|nr:hypothetical protein [Ruegeria arenilitoris]